MRQLSDNDRENMMLSRDFKVWLKDSVGSVDADQYDQIMAFVEREEFSDLIDDLFDAYYREYCRNSEPDPDDMYDAYRDWRGE